MIELYYKVSEQCSKITTQSYSTSFTLGIQLLAKKYHQPIYNIYGFVRFAIKIKGSYLKSLRLLLTRQLNGRLV